MEDQLEKEARFRQLMAHHSHDSAIDTDSLEWETEVVEFEKDRVSASGDWTHTPGNTHVLSVLFTLLLRASWVYQSLSNFILYN